MLKPKHCCRMRQGGVCAPQKSFQFMYILATILLSFIVLRDTKKLNLISKIAARKVCFDKMNLDA